MFKRIALAAALAIAALSSAHAGDFRALRAPRRAARAVDCATLAGDDVLLAGPR